MSFKLNKTKNPVPIALAIIVGIVILVLTGNFIKHKITVNKIHETIQQGSDNLALGKYNDAKKNFEQAVSLQKENKETYILIKDEYLKSKRLDDSLSILKQGKDNKITGLEVFIEEIKQKFVVTNMEVIIKQNETYDFPKKTMIKINNEDINLPIKWKDKKIETNKLGTFVFEGISEEYERSVKLTVHIIPKIESIKELSASIIQGTKYSLPLKVIATLSDKTIKEVDASWSPNKVDTKTVGTQNFIGTVQDYKKNIKIQVIVKPRAIVKTKQIGYVSKVYDEGGKRYLSFDNVNFLVGNEAIDAAIKNGSAVYENGSYYVPDDYCIVNSSNEIKQYDISNNASLNVLGWCINSSRDSSINYFVSYDNFKNTSSKHKNLLCYIYTENDVVVKVEGKYTP